MTIAVERLEDWIGTEARTDSGEKLGKIDDVYFVGPDALAIGIRSGLAGRKHHAVTLKGAKASRDAIRLAVDADALIATDGGALTGAQIAALSGQDERLRDLAPDELEGWGQRQQRLADEEAARANAEQLEAEAQRRAEAEQQAVLSAGDAESAVERARREREEAEARAREAREALDRGDGAPGS